ncbi:hypothetical protein [Streptomyces sp. NPDC058092]|uniref:hypothetical protein n=1 Tax=Streptomyces sp. NPDC058092 TaxID=3346336 RepID=UPI0036E4E4D2
MDHARPATGYTGTERRVHAALPAISAAIGGYDISLGLPARAVPDPRKAVGEAAAWRLAAQYGKVAQHAPQLLVDPLATFHTASGRDRPEAARLLASAARTADAAAYKYGARDRSARLIDKRCDLHDHKSAASFRHFLIMNDRHTCWSGC